MQETAASPTKLCLAARAAHLRAPASSLDSNRALGTLLRVDALPEMDERSLTYHKLWGGTFVTAVEKRKALGAENRITVRAAHLFGGCLHIAFGVLQQAPTTIVGTPDGIRIVAMLLFREVVQMLLVEALAAKSLHLFGRNGRHALETRKLCGTTALDANVEPVGKAVVACVDKTERAGAHVVGAG